MYLVSVSKVLESDESLMIQGMWPDSWRGALGMWTIKNRKLYAQSSEVPKGFDRRRMAAYRASDPSSETQWPKLAAGQVDLLCPQETARDIAHGCRPVRAAAKVPSSLRIPPAAVGRDAFDAVPIVHPPAG
jgi:hypothetical protein